jgi:hypothetical protein
MGSYFSAIICKHHNKIVPEKEEWSYTGNKILRILKKKTNIL